MKLSGKMEEDFAALKELLPAEDILSFDFAAEGGIAFRILYCDPVTDKELLAIFKTDGTGRLHYYCILQSGSTIFLSNAENFGIAVPFHLFAEEEQEAWQYGLYLNNGEYATEYGISEFSAFYEGLEEVKMSAEGDTLSVESQTAPKGGTASCRIVFTFSQGSVLVAATCFLP